MTSLEQERMTLFIHGLYFWSVNLSPWRSQANSDDSRILQNKNFTHTGLYLWERCYFPAKAWTDWHFSLRVPSSVSCCSSVREMVCRVCPNYLSSQQLFHSVYILLLLWIRKAERNMTKGSHKLAKMCNLVVSCIINAALVRVFPYG